MRRLVLACTVCSLLSASPHARAQGTDGPGTDRPRGADDDPKLVAARQAFVEGTALSKQGRWAEALEAYERSASLHTHSVTQYNVGFCQRALGRYTQARVALEAALERGRENPGELPDRLRADAAGFLREIERKLVRLTVKVVDPPLKLSIDGRPLDRLSSGDYVGGTLPVGSAREVPEELVIQLDPGEHSLVVEQRGQTRVTEVDYEPGAVASLTLGTRPADAPDPGYGQRVSAYVAWGLGGAGTVAAIVAGVITLQTKSDLDEVCPADNRQLCPNEFGPDVDRLYEAANVTTAAIVVAGTGLALGTILFFTSPQGRVEADVGLGGASLRIRF